jgi:predicted regulator of Ras-like GTPase activity (Roadblock/LC7/MglB family)
MLGAMDADQAIADLTEISPQVKEVVIVGSDGSVGGSNVAEERAAKIAEAAQRLLETAGAGVAQLEAATGQGSVFVVRDGDRVVAATTTPEPTVGLVFYDLKTCLRSIDEPKPKRRTRRKTENGDAAA